MFSVLFLMFVGIGFVASQQPFIWPLPSQYNTSSNSKIIVSNSFQFQVLNKNYNNDILSQALTRYKNIIFPRIPDETPPSIKPKLISLQIQLENANNMTLQYGVNESYVLNIPPPSSNDNVTGTLTANNVFGILRGLETFSQTIIYSYSDGYYKFNYSYIEVIDSPRFKYRGIMLDTARHFISVNIICNLLDGMSYNKFNVFHWHMVDAESFPFLSKAYPLLTSNGAFSSQQIYSHNDIKYIVKYAKYRGIRVLIEYDMPGHTGSWCKGGYPEICPLASCVNSEQQSNPNNIALNPAANETYNVINGIFDEIFTNPISGPLFIDDYIHLGADEVVYYCWDQTPEITEWMSSNGFSNAQAYQYFVLKVIDIISNPPYNKKVTLWVDAYNTFGSALDTKNTVIEVWKDASTLAQVVGDGFNAILANSNAWYLIYTQITWQQMYENEPLKYIFNQNEADLVMGGEGCQWTEYSDSSDIQNVIWPRASAIAERLWSPRSVNSTKLALPRLQNIRCLMNLRGIAAGLLDVATYGQPPTKPGSCYVQ